MANDSSTGGALLPVSLTTPAQDLDLDVILQGWVAAVSGLAGSLVRPRWQPVVPVVPEINTDWCAIGVLGLKPEDTPYIVHNPAGDGSDTLIRHELVEVLASFYGPNAGRFASILRDGLFIGQNRESLRPYGLAVADVGDMRQAPDLLNQQWRRRIDLPINLLRVVSRAYPVLHFLSASGVISLDDGVSVDFSVNP